jgi:hypothetical protein
VKVDRVFLLTNFKKMKNEKERETMIVYRSFFESLKGCEKTVQADVWNAIFEMGFNQKEVELEGLSKTLWLLIKPQIEANLKRFINGSKPKLKQNKSEMEAKPKQKVSESEANNNNNNNNNNPIPTLDEFVAYGIKQLPEVDEQALRLKYSSWVESNWIVTVGGKTRIIKNWKSTLNNTLPYLPKNTKQPIDPLVVEMKRQRQMYGLE